MGLEDLVSVPGFVPVTSFVTRVGLGTCLVTPASGRATRSRGGIGRLPSGALRVRVYAGIDPVTKRRHYLTEVIRPGPKAQRQAEQARTRLQNQVDERRSPRTGATIAQLLERHLSLLTVGPSTMRGYQAYVG